MRADLSIWDLIQVPRNIVCNKTFYVSTFAEQYGGPRLNRISYIFYVFCWNCAGFQTFAFVAAKECMGKSRFFCAPAFLQFLALTKRCFVCTHLHSVGGPLTGTTETL